MKDCPHCHYRYLARDCPRCRANERAIQRGEILKTCIACRVLRPVCANGECRSCLATRGLQECLGCGQLKLLNLDFGYKQSRCRVCLHPAPRAAPHAKLAKYGISLADYEAAIIRQGGLCAICRRPGPLVIDHDHRTNRFRGLLCKLCNVGVGYFRDSVTHLEAAKTYLQDRGVPPQPLPAPESNPHLAVAYVQLQTAYGETLGRLEAAERALRQSPTQTLTKDGIEYLQALLRSVKRLCQEGRSIGVPTQDRLTKSIEIGLRHLSC